MTAFKMAGKYQRPTASCFFRLQGNPLTPGFNLIGITWRYKSARRNFPNDCNLNQQCSKNHKSCRKIFWFCLRPPYI